MKKTRLLALLLTGLFMGCPHHRGWFRHEDPSIQMLEPEAIMVGSPIDGPTLRALQIATHDFFPTWGPLRACIDTPEAHKYYALRRGNIIYVAIAPDPDYCGRTHAVFDAGVRYAISIDGRILRRLLDGEPGSNATDEEDMELQDSGSVLLDAGAMDIDVTPSVDAQSDFPPLRDGGPGPTPDGGLP